MARAETVYPSDVLEELQKRGGSATRAEIAQGLDCSTGTISRKISMLVKDGENIGFGRRGVFLQTAEEMNDKDNRDRARTWTKRIVASLIQWAYRGNNHKPVAIAARKAFSQELTRDERKSLRESLLLIMRVVDAIDLDEDLS